jgi:ectoine hydroxylase-related dioxygenase (phytanoyl-CoA dioxygenase family)
VGRRDHDKNSPKDPEAWGRFHFHYDFKHLDFSCMAALCQGAPCSLFLLWAEGDFTRENGATQFIAGSHRRPQVTIIERDELRKQQDLHAVAEMSAGSCLVFISTHVLHRAGVNQTDHPRLTRMAAIHGRWKE